MLQIIVKIRLNIDWDFVNFFNTFGDFHIKCPFQKHGAFFLYGVFRLLFFCPFYCDLLCRA